MTSYAGRRSVVALASLSCALAGCGLTLDYDPPPDAAGFDASPTPDAPPGPDTGAPDAPPFDAAPFDVGPVECAVDSDCGSLYGPPPCGAWVCNAASSCDVVCAGCTDGDLDGYGVGTGCAGLDCDDTTDLVTDTSSRSCYAGPAGTSGVGACGAGTEECSGGVWGACFGAITPSAESCNGIDDDCNGLVDDGLGTVSCGLGVCTTTTPLCVGGALAACTAPLPLTTIDGCNSLDDDCDGRVDESCTDCIWVGTTGDDGSPDPRVLATPLATIQAGIDYAVADPSRPQRVCVLSAGCGSGPAIYGGSVVMAEGVTVQGSYALTGTGICATIRSEIRSPDPTGVLFPDTITGGTTTLADIAITPAPTSDTAGVSVVGAVGVVLRNVQVNPSGTGPTIGAGVSIEAGGDALITRSSIFAPRASSEAVGVRVDGARVTLLDNCSVPLDAAGRCPMGCPFAAGVGIHGRNDANGTRAATSYAIQLTDAPGSLVSGTATCGHTSMRGAGVRIEGDASGTVLRGNFLAGWGGQLESYGVDLLDCGGSAPWIVDNYEIDGEAPMTAPSAAIRSLGDCRTVIERNRRIASGLEGQGTTTGILCGPSPGGAASSRCVIEGNPDIRSTTAGFPVMSTGVRCDADGCARVSRNVITAFQGNTLLGMFLGTTDALVSRNRISAGCATLSAIGLETAGSRARVENNVIVGTTPCNAGSAATASRVVGLYAHGSTARVGAVLDARSNTIDPGGAPTTTCASRGVELEAMAGAIALRGNIVLAGTCASAIPLAEASASADPASVECNDLVPVAGGAVYLDEGGTPLASAGAVDGLTDTIAGGNLDSPPGFASYPTNLDLAAGSSNIDADWCAAPPAVDFDGHPRIGVPDIGAYEG